MNIEQIRSAREYHKSQGWDDSPLDEAIDTLLAECNRLQAVNKAFREMLETVVRAHILEAVEKEAGNV